VAFTGATVIDGTGAAPMAGATIVVADGRIQAVGPQRRRPLPERRASICPASSSRPASSTRHGHLQADSSKRPARDPPHGAAADVRRLRHHDGAGPGPPAG
jgi:hypothetical protein